jgi:ABC-type uncharacterized transport system involved in gliding motility auxiliary subunit
MRDRITLNPMFLQPPGSNKEMESLPLAYLLEGSFESYFKGKEIPEKPAVPEEKTAKPEEKQKSPPTSQTETKPDLSQIGGQGSRRDQSAPAKILLIGSSEMVKDNLLDDDGQSTNAMFLMNMIDALNGREAVAAMRSKVQRFNPLRETEPFVKTLIKSVNMAGLPVMVVIFGVVTWALRQARKKKIQALFQNQ